MLGSLRYAVNFTMQVYILGIIKGKNTEGVGRLFGGVLWHINHWRLFNAKSIFIQIISSISNNSAYHEYTV